MIKTDKLSLSETEKVALESLKKMYILAFKSDPNNIENYDKEIKK